MEGERTPGCGILRIIFRREEDWVSLDGGGGPEVYKRLFFGGDSGTCRIFGAWR